MKNKHPKFYQQFLETLNLGSGILDQPKEYEPDSDDERKPKKRTKKEEEKKEDEYRDNNYIQTLTKKRKK